MEIHGGALPSIILTLLFSLASNCIAYRPGDVVPMSKMGQYHSSRTVWHDMIGRHCPIFAVNREALIPIPKPVGYTGADPYKISFQVGREKFLIPWLYVINRNIREVPMIDVHLRYSGSDLLGVTAKVVDMPHHCDVDDESMVILCRTKLCNGLHIPNSRDKKPCKMIISFIDNAVEEQSEIDVASGFYVLFGSGLMLSFMLSIYVLQSSRDKIARFVRETVVETNMPGGVEKVE